MRVSQERPRRLSRSEKKAQTKQRLVEAAADVFRRRGYQAATVEEITAEAGFTRGAFYSNFTSKEELVAELLQRVVYDEYRAMAEKLPRGVSGKERLRWTTRELMKRQERGESDPWIWQLWLELLTQVTRHREFRQLAAGFWRENRATIAGLIEKDYREHGAPAPAKPKDIATGLIALDIGLAIQHLVDDEEVPLETYEVLYELLFGQLVPEPET
jgi:AcrR family transcriptional regulator